MISVKKLEENITEGMFFIMMLLLSPLWVPFYLIGEKMKKKVIK